MKKLIVKTLLVVVGLAVFQQSVFASTATSRVKTVRINKTVASPARTSIEMFSTTTGPCFGNWYAFENAHTGLGKNWTDAVVAAYQVGKTVQIVGTGTCDNKGVEKVNYIDIK
ncbi:hypothetical protein [Methyloglobulus sp.]|uniref:hypothetical protein n=1 Tax=Methyloglobulus sp. TaxID=2518622 RepID=UPI0032B821BE